MKQHHWNHEQNDKSDLTFDANFDNQKVLPYQTQVEERRISINEFPLNVHNTNFTFGHTVEKTLVEKHEIVNDSWKRSEEFNINLLLSQMDWPKAY